MAEGITEEFKELLFKARDTGLLSQVLEGKCTSAIRRNDHDDMDMLKEQLEAIIRFHELTARPGVLLRMLEKLREQVQVLSSEKGFSVLGLIMAVIVLSIAASIFQPSFLKATRIRAMETFCLEVNDIIEGIKRFHWQNNRFPTDRTELTGFMKVSWPANPLGSFSYSTGTGKAVLTITSSSSDTSKYLNIVERQVPFSACSGTSCTVTIPETAVYIRQEIQNVSIVNPGDMVSKPVCAAGMSPDIVLTPVGVADTLGAGISSFRAYPEDTGGSWKVHLCATSIAGGTYSTTGSLTYLSSSPSEFCDDPRLGRVHVLVLCH